MHSLRWKGRVRVQRPDHEMHRCTRRQRSFVPSDDGIVAEEVETQTDGEKGKKELKMGVLKHKF